MGEKKPGQAFNTKPNKVSNYGTKLVWKCRRGVSIVMIVSAKIFDLPVFEVTFLNRPAVLWPGSESGCDLDYSGKTVTGHFFLSSVIQVDVHQFIFIKLCLFVLPRIGDLNLHKHDNK